MTDLFKVPANEPQATAAAPGVTRLHESYAFCEPDRGRPDLFWVGRVRGERTHGTVSYSRAELIELRGRIDVALEVAP